MDSNIQYLIRKELISAQKNFQNTGSGAILMNIKNGEVLSLVSLPDYDLNQRISIDENIFNSVLETKDKPDPDLLIRTSGELRLSNFLLWQSAYAEIYLTETYWPAFREEALMNRSEDTRLNSSHW